MFNFFKNIYQYRELLWSLSLREFKIRYKQTLLGLAWAIVQPLAMMFIFTLVFSKLKMVTNADTGGFPYPIFSYCALVPWTFFSSSLKFGAASIITNMNLLLKTSFPREIFPLSKIIGSFFDYLIAMVVFAVMMIYYAVPVHATIWLFPFVLLVQLVLTSGFCLFLSALNVYFRDIAHAVSLGMFLWLFATPVAYPIGKVPARFIGWYKLNPMVGIIDAYRRVILEGRPPDITLFSYSIIVAIVLFILGYVFFKRSEKDFADII